MMQWFSSKIRTNSLKIMIQMSFLLCYNNWCSLIAQDKNESKKKTIINN